MRCISSPVFPLSVQILVLLIIGADLFCERLVSAVLWLPVRVGWLIYIGLDSG